MTRLLIPQAFPRQPSSIALGELAIAAGVAGHCVTLAYQDFPAPMLCEIWSHYARPFSPHQWLQVFGQRDLRELVSRAGRLRLVLIHAPRLCSTAGWTVGMADTNRPRSCPAIFVRSTPPEGEEPPGPSLVLRAQPAEIAAVSRCLTASGGDGHNWQAIPTPSRIEYDPALAPIQAAMSLENRGGSLGFGDRLLVEAFLMGAALLRTSREAEEAGGLLHVSAADYEHVRGLLQSQIVCRGDEERDRLAIDMVARANAYMAANCGGEPAPAEGATPKITRREVADLGNPRSRTVRRLVEHLRRADGGHGQFRRLGLVGHSPGEAAWQSGPVDNLLAALRPWSLKQVRTHFGRLQRDGFLTAEREHGNGPWRYVLPEELSGNRSLFQALPRIDCTTEAQVPA